jgi:hypothetical protein
MDELKNLLLEQFRFNQDPSASNFTAVQQAMYRYQAARYPTPNIAPRFAPYKPK